MVILRTRSTERYSGDTSTTQRSTAGYRSAGTNVPENRNNANCPDAIRSKSCQLRMNVVSAIPNPPNANPTSTEAASATNAGPDVVRPITTMITRKAAAYT